MAGILERYRPFFNLPDDYPIVSLEEGNTPLIPAHNLSEWIAGQTGLKGLRIFFKTEGLNPTGSFKDRGMTYAVSQAKKTARAPLSAPVRATPAPVRPPTGRAAACKP